AALLSTPMGRVMGLAVASSGVATLVPLLYVPSILRGTAAAAAIALVNSIGNMGGALGPYLVGFSKDRLGGTTDAFLMFAGMALTAGILLLLTRRYARFAQRAPVTPPGSETNRGGTASAVDAAQ